MGKFLLNIILSAVAVLLCAYLIPGVHVDGFLSAIFVALALALLNQFVKPLLVILTIPATILTLGLFLFVVNALIILFADWIVSGFQVDGFWWALLFSIVLAFINSVLQVITGTNKRSQGPGQER